MRNHKWSSMFGRKKIAALSLGVALGAGVLVASGATSASADAWLTYKYTVSSPSGLGINSVAADPATHSVYAEAMSDVDATLNRILAIDGTTGQITDSIAVPTIQDAGQLVVDSAKNLLYAVTSGPNGGNGQVAVMDLTTKQIVTTLTGPALNDAGQIAINPTTHDAYVINYGLGHAGPVVVIDGTTHQVKATINDPMLVNSTGIAFNPVNNLVYVTNLGFRDPPATPSNVAIINPATDTVVKTLSGPAFSGSYAIVADATTGDVYLDSGSSIVEIDGAANAISRTFASSLIQNPTGLAIDENTGSLLIAGGGSLAPDQPQVVSVDLSNGAVSAAAKYSNGQSTRNIAVDSTSRLVYTLNNDFQNPESISILAFRPAPTTMRISAPDRFSNAVEIAKAAFPGAAPVVYVATGMNYPDALGAGAAAASAAGPLLLTTPTDLPASVKAEIQTLSPSKIIVVGGPNSVSDDVFAQLQTLAPTVTRQGGADRYEASRNIVAGQFPHATTAFIATGANFPDALSATSAAASKHAPVLLVPGTNPSVDSQTLGLLDSLGVTDIMITGGPASVSPGIESQLRAKYGSSHVTRLGGADRYEASTAINTQFFTAPTQAFLATGNNFPDALAGGVLAANKTAPLFVVHGDCVPASSISALKAWGVTKVTLIGGTASLTPNVASLKECN